jgi:glyoxylase-like metal-dependent hydrolase (beta-lactamase superfamily II)
MSADVRDAWTVPGVHEIAPGVHRIVCPLPGDGLKAVNVYALTGGDGIALIDTGWRSDAIIAALEDGFATLGASLRDLTAIVSTHSHYDHYGLSAYLRELSGAPVYLGEHERANLGSAIVREEFDRYLADRRALLLRHGARTLADELAAIGFTFEQLQRRGFASWPDRWVGDGERLEVGGRVLEARLTPGHSRGHLMFLSDDLLFAGDHVLPLITPSLGFEAFTDGHALEAFLASLHASRDLPARLVAPGHGPVFEDLAGRFDELLAHHDTRLAACLDALADGPRTAHEVAGRLTWTRRERPFADMDLFNRMLATTETITHLELLADRGDAAREVEGDVVRYAVALTVWSKTSAPFSIR